MDFDDKQLIFQHAFDFLEAVLVNLTITKSKNYSDEYAFIHDILDDLLVRMPLEDFIFVTGWRNLG